MDGQLVFLLFLIVLSGFFSGAEIALVSLSEAKIRTMVEKKQKNAKMIEALKNKPQRLLITILIGNNLVNIGASVMATAWATEKFGNNYLGIITGVLTLLVLIFGEIFPKTLADRYAKHFSMIVAPAILLLQRILFPIVWLLEKLMMSLLPSGEAMDKITEDEIKAMVSVGAESGAIEKKEREFIANILDFSDTRVFEVMVPREKIEALSSSITVDEAIKRCLECGYSRFPVYGNDEDHVLGVLTIQTLLRAKQYRSGAMFIKNLDLNNPILIPESKNLDDLFKEFQWKRQHMAIVVNEHGSVMGLVTLEDLLEEIVGEIEDESDETEVLVEKLSENSWRVNAEISVEDVSEVLDFQFDCDEHKSLRYLLLEKFQKIPRRGEDILIGKFHFFVEKMHGNKIDSVRVVRNS